MAKPARVRPAPESLRCGRKTVFTPPRESQHDPGLQPCGPNTPKPIPVVKGEETSDWPDLSQLSFFLSFLVAPSKLREPGMRKQTEISVFKGGSSACRRDKSNRPSGRKAAPCSLEAIGPQAVV